MTTTEIIGISYIDKLIYVNVAGVTNKGSTTVSNVRVEVTVPEGVAFYQANMPQGDYDPNLHIWDVGILVPAQVIHGELVFKVTDPAYTSFKFEFKISSTDACDDCITDNYYCITYLAYPCGDAFNCIEGDFDDDTDAAANGVSVGEHYYLSDSNEFGLPPGLVKKRTV